VSERKYVKIDLQELYELHPESTAADVLKSILQHYDPESFITLAIINVSPDVGLDISYCRDAEIENIIERLDEELSEFFRLLSRLSEEEMQRFSVRDFDMFIENVAKRIGANIIIDLFDGYESAYAFIKLI